MIIYNIYIYIYIYLIRSNDWIEAFPLQRHPQALPSYIIMTSDSRSYNRFLVYLTILKQITHFVRTHSHLFF